MKKKLLFTFFLITMVITVSAQCSINASTNASVLTCGTSPLTTCNGVLNIGNGSTSITITMDATLDLTYLGPIQMIVNKASIDFSPGNNRLYLSEGSSIVFQNGGGLIGGSCNASERIYVGTNLLASCNGTAGADVSFTTINALGGTGNLASNSPICVGNTINLIATPPPNGTYTYSWSGPGLTATSYLSSSSYSLAATVSGLYQVKMKSSLGYIAIAETTVTVNSGTSSAAPTITTIQPTCFDSTGSITITAPTGSGMKYSINGLTYTNTSGVFNALTPGTYSVTAKNSSGCISPVTSVTINTQPSTLVQPTLGSPTQTTCSVATGSFAISNYNALYTYTVSPSIGVILSGPSVTAPKGSYTVTATLGTCTSVASSSITISQLSTTWNGSSWSNGIPTSAMNIIFNGDYSSTSDLIGCSCTVTSGNVEIESGNTLTITNDITVTGGSFRLEDSGSLVQINDNAVNSGNISIERTSRPMYRWDYVYQGSPVAGNIFSQIPNQYDLKYKYVTNKTSTGNWTPLTATVEGEGFITRVRNMAPFNVAPTPIDFNYTGVPNNGFISTSGTTYDGGATTAYGNSKVLANPYPCAIDAKLFLDDPNNKLYVGGTIYLWTSTTVYSGTGAYEVSDYIPWNKTGGTLGIPPPGLSFDGNIASGQGFMVQMIADGPINFKNYMRIKDFNSNFLRQSNTSLAEVSENHRIWLNMTNETSFRQTLIGYVEGATNGDDRSYDGLTITNSKVDLYSILDEKSLNIQGRSLPFKSDDTVPLGFKTPIVGKLTISIDHVDGLFMENQGIYLEDKVLNIIHDLKQSPYEFSSEIGTFNNRFVLRYTNSTLGINNPDTKIGLTALIFNKKINVQASDKIEQIEIYDMTGKLIKAYQLKAPSKNFEDDFAFAQGIYLAKVRLENDSIITQKLTNNN